MDRPRRAWVEPEASRIPAETPSGALPAGQAQSITVDGLTKSFGATEAVRDLSFTVRPGRVTAFLGPNGAGKTTTLRSMVGLVRPTAGRTLFGTVPYADLPHPQRSVGCVLDAHVHPNRSARNHLRVLAATAQADDARVDALLELVGLAAVSHRPAGSYSVGMRQRLALAAALLGDPNFLVLDEPANGLDPEGIRWLRAFLRRYAASGRTVLVATHLLNEVEATADDIVVINHGRLVVQTEIDELDFDIGSCVVRVSHRRRAQDALTETGTDSELQTDELGDYLRVGSSDIAAVGATLFNAGVAVFELTRERSGLEDRFFALLEQAHLDPAQVPRDEPTGGRPATAGPAAGRSELEPVS